MSDLSFDTAVVLGARNLGAALVRDLLGRGVRVAVVARTQEDLDALARDGAIPVRADAAELDTLGDALARAQAELGQLDVLVNAVSAVRPPGDGSGFGGGAMAHATMAGFDGWTVPPARQAFAFLAAGARALDGQGGTLIQVVGAPARRANPERGPFAAGCAAVRALGHAAAQELRAGGTHVALLIVDGMIASPKTVGLAQTMGLAPEALTRQEDVIAAVRFLAEQAPQGMTHELVLTPSGDRWVP